MVVICEARWRSQSGRSGGADAIVLLWRYSRRFGIEEGRRKRRRKRWIFNQHAPDGVDSIVSASFLGWPFALFKVLAALVTGLLGGWLTELGSSDSSSTEGRPVEASPTNPRHSGHG